MRPEEITARNFVVSWRGYNQDEVRSYLRSLAGDQERLLARIEELENARLPEPLVPTTPDVAAHEFASLVDSAVSKVSERRSRLERLRQTGTGRLWG